MSKVFVKDVLTHLDNLAPAAMKLDFDNVGLLVGRAAREVCRVLVALDITEAVIDEAIDLGAQLIVAHHPIWLEPLRQVTDCNQTERKILKLARQDMAAICMHTNLDASTGGVNDVLAEALGLSDTSILLPVGTLDGLPYGLGRVGVLSAPMTMPDFLAQVKAGVKSEGLRYYDAGRPISRVGVMGGSGSDQLQAAILAGCDTYVVGEAKYHAFLEARERGINLVEADHYCTENLICEPLRTSMQGAFPEMDVTVSARHNQTVKFF